MHFGSRLDFSEHYITTAHNRCLLSIIIITPLSGCIVCCVSCGDEVTFYFTVYSPSSSIYMRQMLLDTDWALIIILWSVQERLNYLIFKYLNLNATLPETWEPKPNVYVDSFHITDSLRRRSIQQTQSSQPQSVSPASSEQQQDSEMKFVLTSDISSDVRLILCHSDIWEEIILPGIRDSVINIPLLSSP